MTGDDTRVRTNFKFDSAQPFTVSFELRRPADPETARFEFRLERVGAPDEEAKFDLRLEDGQVRLEILEAELDDVFPSDADFHTVTFSVGADREATWSIDGTPLLTRADFPAAMFQIEIRTIDAAGGEFHVDNVTLTR